MAQISARRPRTTTAPLRVALPSERRHIAEWAAIVGDSIHTLVRGIPRTIGTASTAGIKIEDPYVSRRHATVENMGGSVRILDLDSTNGVTLAGSTVQQGRIDGVGAVGVGMSTVVVARRVPRLGDNALRWHGMVGRALPTRRLWTEIASAAVAPANVLVTGESGTGKEHVAGALHACSPRRDRPFIALNCAALPIELAESELFGAEAGAFTGATRRRLGAFQRADGGTLLLDEIAELPLAIQAKLLRVLETGEFTPLGATKAVGVDVRVVASTWRDLEEAVHRGQFRADLRHRLDVLRVGVPALRRRTHDIPVLIQNFLADRGAEALAPSPGDMLRLCARPWLGNIRQLKNFVSRVVAHRGSHDWNHGSHCDSGPLPRRGADSDDARRRIQNCLRAHRGNRRETARALGISRSTLYRWLRDLSTP